MTRIPISTLVDDVPDQRPQEQAQKEVQHVNRFGRHYYTWKGWMSPFPHDQEQDQLWVALFALIYEVALNDQFHTANLRTAKEPLRILDVGYGNSEWNFNMAIRYPSAQISGIDLVAVEDTVGYSNLNNISPVDFTSDEWPLPPDTQDLVHISLLCGSVPSWENLYKTAFKYIKPGTGQIEHIEIDWQPRSYPAPFPEEARIVQHWWTLLKAASSQKGRPIACPSPDATEQYLEAAGFVDITRRKIRIPFHCNSRDAQEFQLTNWYRAAMCHVEPPENNAFTSMSMVLLTEVFGMSEEEVSEMCAQVARAINKRFNDRFNEHFNPLYNYLYVYTARKPVRDPPDPEKTRPESAELGASGWNFGGSSKRKRTGKFSFVPKVESALCTGYQYH